MPAKIRNSDLEQGEKGEKKHCFSAPDAPDWNPVIIKENKTP